MSARLRHLKTVVQHTFVLDDGETLVEQVADSLTLSAGQWTEYASGGFQAGFEEIRRQVEGPPEGDG